MNSHELRRINSLLFDFSYMWNNSELHAKQMASQVFLPRMQKFLAVTPRHEIKATIVVIELNKVDVDFSISCDVELGVKFKMTVILKNHPHFYNKSEKQ
jgi:hypothetical protein